MQTKTIKQNQYFLSDKIFDFFNTLFITLFFIILMYPIIYVLSASISSPIAVNSGKVWLLPKDVSFAGYQKVLRDDSIIRGFINSVVYTSMGTSINVVLTVAAGYALSMPVLPGKKLITWVFAFTMFFNGGLIPTYLLIDRLNMLNTIWAMIIPGAVSMWNVVICRTFFQTTIPSSLNDASKIDGCSYIQTLLKVYVPLSMSIIVVLILFCGVMHWNAWFNALIYMRDEKKYPLQMVLRKILIINQEIANLAGDDMKTVVEQVMLADIVKYVVMVVATLPAVIAYPFLQKYFIKGVMIGAIKG